MTSNRPDLELRRQPSGTNIILLALLAALILLAPPTSRATVVVSPLFAHHMVIQRDQSVPVWGTASPNQTVTVAFNGQMRTTISDAQGGWQVVLAPMSAQAAGGNLTISEEGANTLVLNNVVVGDVWVCSGQSNMSFSLGNCDRPADIEGADFPGIRQFWVWPATSADPSPTLAGSWRVCHPSTAAGFSAVAFYFARRIYQDQEAAVPIGLVTCSVGGTGIEPWLAPEGLTDIPPIQPLYRQPILPSGPFSLFHGVIHPLAPYPVKGAIWYQGENRETTSQSADSYFLKEKALVQGWKRLWGRDDFPFYIVQLASFQDPAASVVPEGLGSWSDTRQMQAMVLALRHAGMASAMDIGEAASIHPKDKLDVGERLALWALKNDYGRTGVVPSGPVLRDVTVEGSSLVCSFDHVGAGLMVGFKTPYLPVEEVAGGALARFSIAGADGSWQAAHAVIQDDRVVVSSPLVPAPRKVAYACWANPAGANLYNRDGLPASPFYVDDVAVKYTVTASAGAGGSVNPAGASVFLRRMTVGYVITPEPGCYILDVQIDGASVGAVPHYTFDPLQADHTLVATFASNAPTYTIRATAGPGGLISPSGAVLVEQGGTETFSVNPDPGVLPSLWVDGHPMGVRRRYVFGDVRSDHTIDISFSCEIRAQAGFGGSVSAAGVSRLDYGGSKTYTVAPFPGYAILKVLVDGLNVGAVSSYTFTNVTTSHTITASFVGDAGSATGDVPQPDQLLFCCLVDSLPTEGTVNSWPTHLPPGRALSRIGSPVVDLIDGRKFVQNNSSDGDGFDLGAYTEPIPCAGATDVAAVEPVGNGISSPWTSIVDVFYDRLVLGIMNDSGKVVVRRQGNLAFSAVSIPDRQITILSLVVQSNGAYQVWANGSEIMSDATPGAMTSLVPGGAGSFATRITVGRNWPNQWSTFNGDVGDLFVYTTALPDAERLVLEQHLAGRLGHAADSTRTVTSTWGAGGAISPAGDVLLNAGADLAFTIAPQPGYAVADVAVDGAPQGPLTSYTFTNVTVFHAIHATFAPLPPTPRFRAVARDGTNLVLSSLAAPNRPSRLWFTTNLAGPRAGWTILETNLVGASGLFTNTTPIPPGGPRRFFVLSTP